MFNQDELQQKSILGQINENPGSQYEFRRVPRNIKKAYINNNSVLTKAESWMSMDDKLRNLYILTTIHDNALTKFSNFKFINSKGVNGIIREIKGYVRRDKYGLGLDIKG